MASKSTSFYLSEEALTKLDRLVTSMRMDGLDSNRSVAVEHLIACAHSSLKRVEPVYETVGKRKKLIGFDAWYGDDLIDTRDTRAAAQAALDAYVYEELSR